jgi:hypothetical protein
MFGKKFLTFFLIDNRTSTKLAPDLLHAHFTHARTQYDAKSMPAVMSVTNG